MKRILVFITLLLSLSALLGNSKGVNFLCSIVVPGSSQVASGRIYGYAMLASEVAILGSIYYFNVESDVLMQDSYEYAIHYAHINPGDYDNEFYNYLSRYDSSGFDAGGYNAWVRQTAMAQFPYDPQQQQEFINTYSYGDDKYWAWDDSSNRSEFNRMRNRSSDYKDYALVAGGVLLLNHLISGIDALRFSANEKRSHVSFGIQEKTPVIKLSYQW